MKNRLFKKSIIYLAVSLFCIVFAAVYEHFSHGVYSSYMIGAFAFPLILGALPYLILYILYRHHLQGSKSGISQLLPCIPAEYALGFGIATLTVGSIVNGALEIYGTTNRFLKIYWIAGAAFICIAIMCYIMQLALLAKARRNS